MDRNLTISTDTECATSPKESIGSKQTSNEVPYSLEYDSTPAIEDSITTRLKKYKSRVANACDSCKRLRSKCSDSRPCFKCVKHGRAATCVDSDFAFEFEVLFLVYCDGDVFFLLKRYYFVREPILRSALSQPISSECATFFKAGIVK